MKDREIRKIVKENYSKIAVTGCSCGCGSKLTSRQISKAIGYSDEDICAHPEANLGLGCGNPIALAEIKEGDTVLDLGSGAGFDAFLAAKRVGKKGRVIGVDMTEEMIKKASENAKKYGYKNTEFRMGDIEDLPVDDNSIDIVISNCVINLAPDKSKVFKEAYRVLKKGGRMVASDIVLLKELTKVQRADHDLITGCVGGALLKDEYMRIILEAGFRVEILHEDKEIDKKQYNDVAFESLTFLARK